MRVIREGKTLFVDFLSEASRRCHIWAEQQPEAFNDRGRKDLRDQRVRVQGNGGYELLQLFGTLLHSLKRLRIRCLGLQGEPISYAHE